MIGNAFNRGKGLHAGTSSPSVIQTDTVVRNQTNWPANNYWKQNTPVIANKNWMKELALDVMPNGEVGEHFNEICEQQEKDTYVCGPAKEIQPIQ
uniref:SCP domain-containing protein n=1 Tax=Heterorhabditis bacteriophora TaxID=37862 RepID=A0A1I7XM64_HETBA